MRQSPKSWLPEGLITTTSDGNQLVRRDGQWNAFGSDQDVDHVGRSAGRPRAEPPAPRPPSAAPTLNARQRAVADMAALEARRQGLSPRLAVTTASIESTLGQNKVNPDSRAVGVYQFLPAAWAEMGGGDRFDDAQNITHGVTYLRKSAASLRRTLGRDPEDWQAYLAHQQGSNGARALLSGGDRAAIDVLIAAGVKPSTARSSVLNNGGRADMSAADFSRSIQDRYRAAADHVARTGYWEKPQAVDEDDHWPRR
jgi:hypothetical protein